MRHAQLQKLVYLFELRRDMYHWFIDRVERLVRRGGAELRLAPLRCGTKSYEASAPLSPHEHLLPGVNTRGQQICQFEKCEVRRPAPHRLVEVTPFFPDRAPGPANQMRRDRAEL